MPELPEPLDGGRFEFEELLGRGGFGEVWRCRDRLIGRRVAIKLLKAELFRHPDWRVRRTDTIAARLKSRHIVQVYDLIEERDGEGRERCGIVMELIPGPSLGDRLRNRKPLPIEETLRAARALAEALDAAHRCGIVHRDIKPSNLLLGLSERDDPKVVDWGLAFGVPDWNRSTTGGGNASTATWGVNDGGPFRFAGTPPYMAPEQLRGQVDGRADIWAFGCVLYECLSGQPAFAQTGPALVEAIGAGAIDWSLLPASTPERMRQLLAVCLEVDPAKRLSDVADAIPLLEGRAARSASEERRRVADGLPPPPAVEIPRPALVERVESLLASSPLVALGGSAGSGKSWTGLAVARRWLAKGTVLAVDLRDVASRDEALARLARAIDTPAGAAIEALAERLRERGEEEILLLVDNADALLPGLSSDLATLRGAGVAVLLTARRVPAQGSWSTLRVDPLECPPESALSNEREIARFEAVRLFSSLASLAWREFRLDASNAAAISALVRQVGGLPGAIELLASRVRLASPSELLPRIDQIVRPLVEGGSAQTMTRTIEWSIAAASPAERRLLERLAVFEGSWTLPSVEAVCCDDELPAADLHNLLIGLIDQGLVLPEAGSGRPRHRLLALGRDLCRRHLEAPARAAELEALRRRHAARFAALVGAAGASGDRLDAAFERADCCAAIRFAIGRPDLLELAADMAIELQDEWYDRGRYREGLDLLEPLLRAWGGRGGVREVRLLAADAKLRWLADPRAAYRGYQRALELERRIVAEASDEARPVEEFRLAAVLHNVGLTAQQSFAFIASREALAESIERYRLIGAGKAQLAIPDLSLAILDYYEGRDAEAGPALDRCVSIFHASGDLIRLATALHYRSRLSLRAGDWKQAAQITRDALAVRRRDGEVEGIAASFLLAGEIALASGNALACVRLFAAAERRRRGLGLEVAATDVREYESALHSARQSLGLAEFDAAWAEGATLADEEASALLASLLPPALGSG